MRRGGRPVPAVLVILTLCVQSTGAANLAFIAPVQPPALLVSPLRLPPPHLSQALPKAPRVRLPNDGAWGKLLDSIAPAVDYCDRWLSAPVALPDLNRLFSWAEEPAPIPAARVQQEEQPREAAAPVPTPVDEAPDRMLIDHHDFQIAGVAGEEEVRQWRASAAPTHEVVAPRLDGIWRQHHGLRYRINFLRPEGFFQMGYAETVMTEGANTQHFPQKPGAIPARYWGMYALYHEGDMVDYEIEIENASGKELENLSVFTGQEGFTFSGGVGRVLGGLRLQTVKALEPGGRVLLFRQARLSGFEAAGSNLEQTHLSVETQRGLIRTRLVDDPQAALVDPPRSR